MQVKYDIYKKNVASFAKSCTQICFLSLYFAILHAKYREPLIN